MKCPECEGEREQKCKNCEGKGKAEGFGVCPTCEGLRIVACPRCATIEKSENGKELVALDDLRTKKLISAEDYFLKRRVLVSQEKARREAAKR